MVFSVVGQLIRHLRRHPRNSADCNPQMTIVLPALAAAFAAFCVWLSVRIVNRRERWAKWMLATAFIGTPMLYVASFGPVCWWFTDRELDGGEVVNIAPSLYWPIGWLAGDGPEPLSSAINWYGTIWIYWVHVPTDLDGDRWIVLVQKSE